MKKLLYYKYLFFVLTAKDVKLRYKNTVLGFIWSVANPLCFGLILAVAFKFIMKFKVPNYPLFLLCALFPWQWFAVCLGVAPAIFITNANLLKKVKFPAHVLIMSSIGDNLFHFILSLPVLYVFIYIYSIKDPNIQFHSIAWIGIPILLVIQGLVTFGLSLLIASLNVFFRDLANITNLTVLFLFYLTPIIYPKEMIPPKYLGLFNLNPLFAVITSWRQMFMQGTLDVQLLLMGLGWGVAISGMAFLVFNRLNKRFTEVL